VTQNILIPENWRKFNGPETPLSLLFAGPELPYSLYYFLFDANTNKNSKSFIFINFLIFPGFLGIILRLSVLRSY